MFSSVVSARVLAGLAGVLLGRQAVGVPAHRVQDVEAVHPLEAAEDIGGGVAFGVADVQAGAAGVREHVEDVALRLARRARFAGVGGAEGLVRFPEVLPPAFDVGRVVTRHGWIAWVRVVRIVLAYVRAQTPVYGRTAACGVGFDRARPVTIGRSPTQRGLPMPDSVAMFVAGLIVLGIGAELFSRAMMWVVRSVGSGGSIEVVVVSAVSYAAPVLTVCLAIALSHFPKTALATVLGANIANVGLVLGVAASSGRSWVARGRWRRGLSYSWRCRCSSGSWHATTS